MLCTVIFSLLHYILLFSVVLYFTLLILFFYTVIPGLFYRIFCFLYCNFFYFSVIFNLTPFSFMKPAGFCPFIFTPFHCVLILFELLFFPFALLTFTFTLKLVFTVIFTFMGHQPYFSAQLSLRLNHSDKL